MNRTASPSHVVGKPRNQWLWLAFFLVVLVLLVFGSKLALPLYTLLAKPFSWLAEPVNTVRSSLNLPLLGAFLLGLLGALAPCQLSTGVAAAAWFGKDSSQGLAWSKVTFFFVGKVIVYVGFAFIALVLFKGEMTAPGGLFITVRKLISPVMIVMGLFLLGLVRLPAPNLTLNRFYTWAQARGGYLGAFALGVAFSLAFCPTMFWLFFGLMLPSALDSSLGALFPLAFALGTSLPLLLVLLLLDSGKKNSGKKKGQVLGTMRRGGQWLNLVAGVLLVLIGLYDTTIYWFL
jgi:cytochrome c-type biogenesis protein